MQKKINRNAGRSDEGLGTRYSLQTHAGRSDEGLGIYCSLGTRYSLQANVGRSDEGLAQAGDFLGIIF